MKCRECGNKVKSLSYYNKKLLCPRCYSRFKWEYHKAEKRNKNARYKARKKQEQERQERD